MALTIQALKVGTVHGFSQAALTFSRGHFVEVDFAIYMFLVRGGDKLVLVDTGPGTPAEVRERHGFTMTQLPDEEPRAALAKAGVQPEDVEIVVNTHLHWDHCSNNDVFTNAQIFVQGSELHYAAHPLPTGRASYERKPGMAPAWTRAFDRTFGRDGDYELIPGVEVVTLPGHTPALRRSGPGAFEEVPDRRRLHQLLRELGGRCQRLAHSLWFVHKPGGLLSLVRQD